MVGLAREEVAAARAAVDQEPVPGGVPPLDLLAVRRRRARHQPTRLLLDPAEGGDVVVGAQQEAGLRGASLRGQVGLPFRQAMGALGQPARHLGRVPVAHGAPQHRQGQAVDLQVEDARHVGHHAFARAARDALDHAQGVRVVVVGAQEHFEDHRHRGHDDGGGQRRPERIHLERAVGDLRGQQEDQDVDEEHEQEAGDDHEGQAQRRDERRQKRVEQRDEGRRHERPERPLDVHAGHQPGGDVHRQRRRHPREEDTADMPARARGHP